jgi:hypothetical protein
MRGCSFQTVIALIPVVPGQNVDAQVDYFSTNPLYIDEYQDESQIPGTEKTGTRQPIKDPLAVGGKNVISW